MAKDTYLNKIISLDRPTLTKWIKDRLSGRPGLLPPQSSKGEDPEDLIVLLHHSGTLEFKERIERTIVNLLKEQVASATRQLDLSLLSRLAFLADALEVKSAAPLLMSFLFREELHRKTTPHGDLQELILRCLLGLNPKQFDRRFWKLHLEDPTFVAVALRGLAITDPPEAVKELPRVFEVAASKKIDVDAKLLLWRIADGWNHREFLTLLAESVKGSSAAARSAIETTVEELPFDAASKEQFKTITRSALPAWTTIMDVFTAAPSGGSPPDIEPQANEDWSAVFKDTLSMTPDIEIFHLGHKDAFYLAGIKAHIAAPKPAAVKGPAYADILGKDAFDGAIKASIASPKSAAVKERAYLDIMGYWDVHDDLSSSQIMLVGAGFMPNKQRLGSRGTSSRWTQMSFAGFCDPLLDSSAYSPVTYEAEFTEGAGDYEAILSSNVQPTSGLRLVNVSEQLDPIIKTNFYSGIFWPQNSQDGD
jgi:hypothetical protein